MELLALSLLIVIAVAALTRMPGVFAPALVTEGSVHGTIPAPGDDDEQQPETDRAPSRPWLPGAVLAVAGLRLVLLLTLHA
ncbi:MAG: hypothetical protein ACXWLM_11200 [Myxococcales bacterium]